MKKWTQASSFLSLLLIWYLIYLVIDHPILMPSIIDTIQSLFKLLVEKDALLSITTTFLRLMVSVGISFLLSLILSFLSYKYKHVETFVHPYMVLFKTAPLVSVILILYVLVHFRIAPYIITMLMMTPIFYQVFLSGLKGIDQTYIDIYLLEDNKTKTSIQFLYYPLLKPYIIIGLLQAVGLGIKVLVMAEFITQSRSGIGRLIYDAKINLDYSTIYAITILLIVVAYLIERMIKRYEKTESRLI
jgi:NitT/TauT family transport system permease protein